MKIMSYLRLRNGVYWYRRVIPAPLRGRIGVVEGFPDASRRSELTKSLATRSKAEANRRCGLIDRVVQDAFDGALREASPPATIHSVSITPQMVTLALEQWRRRRIEAIRMLCFVGADELTPEEQVTIITDGEHMIQQFARYSRANPDLWRSIPGFDEALCAALVSEGVAIDLQHPALTRIRPSFALAWEGILRAARDLRHTSGGIWDNGDAPDEAVVAVPEKGKPSNSATRFDKHVAEWAAAQTNPTARQTSIYRKYIEEFASYDGGVYLETLSKKIANRFAHGLLVLGGGKELTTKSVRSQLAALRDYWGFLQRHEYVGDSQPFHGIKLIKREGIKKKDFSGEDVVKIWKAALDTKRPVLPDLIRFAAFTGARIESIFQLKDTDIRFDPKSFCNYIHIKRDKTESGIRDIPICKALQPLIDRLVSESAKRDGYLFASATSNQYDERSTAEGKAFGRLKKALGFGPEHSFHSLRRTAATLFLDADVIEGTAADIMGHRKPTMTFGVYAATTKMSVRLVAMESALIFPDVAFMTAQ